MANLRFILEKDSVQRPAEVLGEISVDFEPEGDEIFLRRKLNGSVKFVGDSYNYLKQFDNLTNACDKIFLIIEQQCGAGGYTEFWKGFFAIQNCTINEDACFIEVSPEVEDQYTCLLKQYDIESRNPFDTDINALIPPAQFQPISWLTHNQFFASTTFLYQGIEVKESGAAPDIADDNWIPDQFPKGVSYNGLSIEGFEDLWTIYESTLTRTGSSPNPGFGIYDVQGTVICEVKGQFNRPDGAGWRFFGNGDWIRKYTNDQYGDLNHSLAGSTPNFTYDMADPDADLFDSNELLFANEMCFFNAYIEAFADLLCGIPVRSEVMGINPNDPAAVFTNPVTGAVNEWPLTVMTETKWVERPWRTWQDATAADTHSSLTFKEVLDGLKAYEFYWYIDDAGTLVIDHISIIRQAQALDLTGTKYLRCFENKGQFTYENVENVRNEEFIYPNAFYYDFTGEPIRYDSACTDFGEGEKNKRTDMPWSTDFFSIGNYPEEFESKVLLVTLNGTQIPPFGPIVRDSVGALSGFTRSNNELSNANLQDKYSRWNRVLPEGELNNVQTTFNSTQKFRKQQELEIPYCCDDQQVDGLADILTKFGTAELVSATHKTKTDTLVINLKY